MSGLTRRRFFSLAAAVTGATVVGAALSDTDARAPAGSAVRSRRHGDLRDVKHVVILTQENRSFDHYFGTMRGVRGFGDRSAITLPGGRSVFQQPTTPPGAPVSATQFPWRLSDGAASAYPAGHQPPSAHAGAQGCTDLPHSWDDQHRAWFGGVMNGWVFAKGGLTTLGYLDRRDIPFHYALADAYTVGDAYHCSVLSATGPNRTYLWSGTVDAQQRFSKYAAFDGHNELGKDLLWETYAETLQTAGVTWRVYQCADDYNNNGLEYFKAFAQHDPMQGGAAAPGNAFYDNGVANVAEPLVGVRANADNLTNAIRADVVAGTLPQVSWVVTNQAFSEHPDGAPNDGAYYVSGVLEALNADPDVFNSTVVIIDYDENDGQFDHVPPPVPAPGTTDEFILDTSGPLASAGVTTPMPVGLGFRVPLVLISPWTRGGWVTSELSDHTSVIQFIEKWTAALGSPARCPNISAWRRSVCGDLTAAFDFTSPVFGLPPLPPTTVIGDPAGGSYRPPATTNAMPRQEPGTKRARALPYQPNANLDGFAVAGNGAVEAKLSLSNHGPHVRKASHFAVYNNIAPRRSLAEYPTMFPTQHTVAPSFTARKATVSAAIPIGTGSRGGAYDLTVIGPNRFLRRFTGDTNAAGTQAHVAATYYQRGFDAAPTLTLVLTNNAATGVTFAITLNHYTRHRSTTHHVPPHGHTRHSMNPLRSGDGWYDFTVTVSTDTTWTRRYTGHLENGTNSITG